MGFRSNAFRALSRIEPEIPEQLASSIVQSKKLAMLLVKVRVPFFSKVTKEKGVSRDGKDRTRDHGIADELYSADGWVKHVLLPM